MPQLVLVQYPWILLHGPVALLGAIEVVCGGLLGLVHGCLVDGHETAAEAFSGAHRWVHDIIVLLAVFLTLWR